MLSIVLAAGLLVLASAVAAYGWCEYDATWTGDPWDCAACHTEEFPFAAPYSGQGPHSGFTITTSKCSACHSVHGATDGAMVLLFEPTLKANCFTCHDGSGGSGVYGTLASEGVAVGAAHRIDTATVIPGGDGGTGGSRTATFTGENHRLSCDDCHSPHNAVTVAPFRGERVRFAPMEGNYRPTFSSNRLLKQHPTSGDATVSVYGSDWCASCHNGRRSGMSVVNHPVDSLQVTTTPFDYGRVAIMTSDTSTVTTIGPMGYLGTYPAGGPTNRGFVMPYPRTSDQAGHAPICQQCHEDSRHVGSVGTVTPVVITGTATATIRATTRGSRRSRTRA